MSQVNQKAPDFTLPDQDNTYHSLADYKGRWVLLYFYPKDDTPGCTTEACSFRDALNDLKELGVQVLGVSADSVASHQKFADKFKLNFSLLADVDKQVINAYSVTRRESFLINPEGVMVKHYEKVKPEEHVAQVMADYKKLKPGD